MHGNAHACALMHTRAHTRYRRVTPSLSLTLLRALASVRFCDFGHDVKGVLDALLLARAAQLGQRLVATVPKHIVRTV
jgi:hypothetical protein